MDENIGAAKKNQKLKKIVKIVAASLVGVSIVNITAAIVAYNSIFPRYERPDYRITPGLYTFERLGGSISRERMYFYSGDNRLAGYYYPSEDPRGLVVLAHGIKSGSDDYLALTEAMCLGGYSVFTYDLTGTYDSEGDSTVGMCQSLIDLDRALNFIGSCERFSGMPIYLVGHSWGGYAVTSVLALHPEVRACVGIAPMNDGTEIMVQKGEEYVGKLAYVGKPVFDVYQRILFDDYVEYNGVRGINSTDIPILIAQGVDDTVITPDGQSVTALRDKITNPNVEYYFTDGKQGSHMGILYSAAALEYQEKVASELSTLIVMKGRKLSGEELAAFYRSVDHRKYTEVNPELLAKIFETFGKAR